jgi:predicted RNA-binding Zn ribbon-like protein
MRFVEAVLADQRDHLTNEAVAMAQRRDAGNALREFFATLVLDHPDAASLAASLTHSPLREAVDVLLRKAQRGGTVRKDINVDDLAALAVGAATAAKQAGANELARKRTLAVLQDGLRARRHGLSGGALR